MSDQQQHASQSIKLKPIINYPREAQAGQTYLMSIDVQLASADAPWPYPDEEYPISFILNMQPYFRYEALNGEDRAGVVLHRFGGTYGPAHYLLTASKQPVSPGHISITFINRWGLPITYLELECEVRRGMTPYAQREETLERKESVAVIEERAEYPIKSAAREGRPNFDRIQAQLEQTGWVVQVFSDIDLSRHRGIAVAHLPNLPDDYLLFVDRQLAGIINVSAIGESLAGVEEEVPLKPLEGLLESWLKIPAKHTNYRMLPFVYRSTGVETRFTNDLEPEPRSRSVFTFHRPETLALWLEQGPPDVPVERNNLLRSRLRRMPPLSRVDLRECQYEAITNLERSFAENHSRALIQMATGSGKTYMAVSSIYRLIKFGNARRVLFLVDRTILAQQALQQFQQYVAPDTGRKFTELYNVQHLQNNRFDPASRVCITTIQRLYSLLTGQISNQEEEIFEEENHNQEQEPRVVSYHPTSPVEHFDIIFVDECHRSIYSEWRPVLEYFDAFLVGLTSTPDNRTFAFFSRNLVYAYNSAQAVADGINVDYDIYHIRTRITEHGSSIERDNMLYSRNKETRIRTYEQLSDDLVYEGRHLDLEIVSIDQIRTVITAYKDALFTELFPGRKEVPKTIIFAKNDSHADDIVQIVCEVFGKSNDFAQKITHRVTKMNPTEVIRRFRTDYNPRILVAVNMLLGLDIKPVEVLVFLRPVQSRALYEQMIGLGCHSILDEELRLVTPDAGSKTHFIVIDAVGVTDNLKTDNLPLERKRSLSLNDLMQEVANGNYEDDLLTSLAGRLGRLVKRVTPDNYEALTNLTGGTLQDLANGLLNAVSYDQQFARACELTGQDDPPISKIEEAALQLAKNATLPFALPELRDLILLLQRREKQIIDDVSLDVVISQGFDEERAHQEIANFRALMEQNKDQIALFELALKRPIDIFQNESQTTARAIQIPNLGLNRGDINRIWRAYQKLERSRVRGTETRRLLIDIISLIRYTTQREIDNNAILEPFSDTVNRRFATWLDQQQRTREQPFTSEQIRWRELIRDRIAADLHFTEQDFDLAPFISYGGRFAVHSLFGSDLPTILQELNEVLVQELP
jgi:type I restriction enzyme R subunit